MPPYPWLLRDELSTKNTAAKIRALQTLGTPYPDRYDEIAVDDLHKQASIIAETLRKDGIDGDKLEEKEIIAVIAYMQRLGTDIKPAPQAGN